MKKLFLITILTVSGTLTFCEEQATPTQKETVIAQLTTGPVSAKTERVVKELLEKFGVDTSDPEIVIAQPSSLAKELNPVIEMPTSIIPPYKIHLINESYFNKLSHPEKEVMIASNAMNALKGIGWKIPGTSLSIPKEIAGSPFWWFMLMFIFEIVCMVAIYLFLGKKTQLTGLRRAIIAFVTIFILSSLHELWKQKTTNPMAKVYGQDRKLTEMIGSPDGYIAFFKRMQKDVQAFKKSANGAFWQNYETTLAPRINYLESLKK